MELDEDDKHYCTLYTSHVTWSLGSTSSFKMMLPYFFTYDDLNYAKWGSAYLAEINMLPDF